MTYTLLAYLAQYIVLEFMVAHLLPESVVVCIAILTAFISAFKTLILQHYGLNYINQKGATHWIYYMYHTIFPSKTDVNK